MPRCWGTCWRSSAERENALGATADTVWGLAVLSAVVVLSIAGGYRALERIQLVVVVLMLAAVTLAMLIFQPDWGQLLTGLLWPQRLELPAWLLQDPRPACRAIAEQPVWVEATLYVGVIGGSGYDYLAYVSFLAATRTGAWPLQMTGLPVQQTHRRPPRAACGAGFVPR